MGNSALHLTTIHGHIDCVSFLINFGVNLWALNNDYQTAKDVTVRAHCDSKKAQELLILLDESMARALMMNPKSVSKQQEKALTEAEKRIKHFEKIQKKSLKKAEKEEKQLERVRSKLIVAPVNGDNSIKDRPYAQLSGSGSNQSTTSRSGSSRYPECNVKMVGKLFQTNTSSRNNLIKSLSNISHPQIDQLSGQTKETSCPASRECITVTTACEDEDGLEVIECQQPSKSVNVRGIMSEVLKNNRSKSNDVSRPGDNDQEASQCLMAGPKMVRGKSGSTIQLFESKLAPKVTPKTFSQIVNSDRNQRNNNYSNGLTYANYKSRKSNGYQSSGSSASSSVSSSWKGTISKINKLAINTSLGAVSKRILLRKASTGSTNSGTSNQSNLSSDGVILKQLLIKSGSLTNLSTIYCTNDPSDRKQSSGKERNGFTLSGTSSSKSSFSSGNNNESLGYSDEFKMVEKINENCGIESKIKLRPLSGVRSLKEPEQVLYVKKKPSLESIDQRLIGRAAVSSNLYMSHKSHESNCVSMYHSMNSLSMKSQPWIEMFQKKTQL